MFHRQQCVVKMIRIDKKINNSKKSIIAVQKIDLYSVCTMFERTTINGNNLFRISFYFSIFLFKKKTRFCFNQNAF